MGDLLPCLSCRETNPGIVPATVTGEPEPPEVFLYRGKVMAVLRSKDQTIHISGSVTDLRLVGVLAVDHKTILDPETQKPVDTCQLGDGFCYYEDVKDYFARKKDPD